MQAMRDFLRGSLARSLRTAPGEDRLSAALPIVCGSALAAHCSVSRLDEAGTLHLRVLGRDWLAPLLAMREVLQGDLSRVAGVPLRGLHFEVAGTNSPRGSWENPQRAENPQPAQEPASAGVMAPPPRGATTPRARNRRSA